MEKRISCVKRQNRTELIINTQRRLVTETLYRIPGNVILQRKYYQMHNLKDLKRIYNERFQYKVSIGYNMESKLFGKVIQLQRR